MFWSGLVKTIELSNIYSKGFNTLAKNSVSRKLLSILQYTDLQLLEILFQITEIQECKHIHDLLLLRGLSLLENAVQVTPTLMTLQLFAVGSLNAPLYVFHKRWCAVWMWYIGATRLQTLSGFSTTAS